jgi:GNAT superfamily N-acetyltransferase
VQFADAIEAAAYRDLYAAAPADFARSLRLQACDIGTATALVAGAVPEAFFNRVIGLGVHAAATPADLDRAAALYRGAGCARHWVHVTPAARPAELEAWLRQRGYAVAARRSWAKMVRTTAPPPVVQSPLEVRRALVHERGAVAAAITSAFDMPLPFATWFEAVMHRPNWRTYAAVSGGDVVGGGLLFFDATGAWLGAGGLRPDFRGRHAHRALMVLRINEAIDAGCARIATETGEPIDGEPNPSLANMAFCGFRKVCSRLNYASAAA